MLFFICLINFIGNILGIRNSAASSVVNSVNENKSMRVTDDSMASSGNAVWDPRLLNLIQRGWSGDANERPTMRGMY